MLPAIWVALWRRQSCSLSPQSSRSCCWENVAWQQKRRMDSVCHSEFSEIQLVSETKELQTRVESITPRVKDGQRIPIVIRICQSGRAVWTSHGPLATWDEWRISAPWIGNPPFNLVKSHLVLSPTSAGWCFFHFWIGDESKFREKGTKHAVHFQSCIASFFWDGYPDLCGLNADDWVKTVNLLTGADAITMSQSSDFLVIIRIWRMIQWWYIHFGSTTTLGIYVHLYTYVKCTCILYIYSTYIIWYIYM